MKKHDFWELLKTELSVFANEFQLSNQMFLLKLTRVKCITPQETWCYVQMQGRICPKQVKTWKKGY